MAVPRNRHSNARKQSKRSHSAKKRVCLATCSNCNLWHKTHCVCPHCGFYKNRVVLKIAAKE